MQYKVSPTDVLLSPKDGPTIQLWKKDVVGQVKVLVGFQILFHFVQYGELMN
jgi:hypothetical protein